MAYSKKTVSKAINKFRNHPSIILCSEKHVGIGCTSFAFEFVSLEEKIEEVNKLSIKKASQTLDIPVKII